MVDMAHIAGLVATGLHMNPVPYADFVTSTTHKTLRGPRGGIILCKQEYAKKINSAVFPGTQGGPLMHVIASKAVAFKEALYLPSRLIRASRQECKGALPLIDHGIRLVTGGQIRIFFGQPMRYGVTGKNYKIVSTMSISRRTKYDSI